MFELYVRLLHGAKFEKGRLEDAGFDLYSMVDAELPPGEKVQLPVGIMTAFPEDYVGLVFDRSSRGAQGLSRLAGVIDSGYRGEWGVMLVNLGRGTVHIESVIYNKMAKAVAQAVFVPRMKVTPHFVEELPPSVRGDAWRGSTDAK